MNRIYNKEQERGGVMGYSIKTKLKEIMKSEAAMDVLEKYVPGVKQNPQLKLGASMPIDSGIWHHPCRSQSLEYPLYPLIG